MRLRTILLVLTYIVIVLFMMPVLLFCMLAGIRDPMMAIGKWAMRLSRSVLGLPIEVSGLGSLDLEQPYIFMANHVSFLDGPMMFMLIPQPVRVILKKEVFRLPVIGPGMTFVEFVSVDRKGAKGGKVAIERAARLMKEKGYSFLIFPEGTRSRDGELQKLRRGGFFLALESGVPIVPISIKGTFEMMPRGSLFIRKGRIRVTFHPAVPVQGFRQDSLTELIHQVRDSIQTGLSEEAG
jgi:1-acyl-sn-glycerol-3-phosphate acyltransferase